MDEEAFTAGKQQGQALKQGSLTSETVLMPWKVPYHVLCAQRQVGNVT